MFHFALYKKIKEGEVGKNTKLSKTKWLKMTKKTRKVVGDEIVKK